MERLDIPSVLYVGDTNAFENFSYNERIANWRFLLTSQIHPWSRREIEDYILLNTSITELLDRWHNTFSCFGVSDIDRLLRYRTVHWCYQIYGVWLILALVANCVVNTCLPPQQKYLISLLSNVWKKWWFKKTLQGSAIVTNNLSDII